MADCEGDCDTHVGEVQRVEVDSLDHPYLPMTFDYCETAVAEDRSRGFMVRSSSDAGESEVED